MEGANCASGSPMQQSLRSDDHTLRSEIGMEEKESNSWLRRNKVAILVGTIATIVAGSAAFISNAETLYKFTLVVLNIPDCLRYAEIYQGPYSYWKNEGVKNGDISWREYQKNVSMDFKELRRDRESIYIQNLTPRLDPRATADGGMVLRIPVCGGTVKWTYQNPEYWIDLTEVWPK